MDCDSVNYMIRLSTNTPFRVQSWTNLLAAQHVRTKITLKKFDSTIPHIDSLRRIAESAHCSAEQRSMRLC